MGCINYLEIIVCFGMIYAVHHGSLMADRNDGWGEYPDPGVNAPQRDPGTESHYDYGSRAGVWRLTRIFEEASIRLALNQL